MKNNDFFVNYLLEIIRSVRKIIKESPLLDQQTGQTNVKGDRTIAMDKKIEDLLINYAKKNSLPVDIFSEEIGIVKYHKNPTHLMVFDPLDGSTNYCLGKNLLPYGLLIAIYKGIQPKLKDVIVSGAIECTLDRAWIFDGKKTKTLQGNFIKLQKDWEISRSTPVYLDLYRNEAYKFFLPLAEKVHIRWNGSTIGSLNYVLSKAATAMGNYNMRPEEIGTIFSLIKGASGVAVDYQGRDLGNYDFSPNKNYPILAGNKKVVDYIIEQLRPSL